MPGYKWENTAGVLCKLVGTNISKYLQIYIDKMPVKKKKIDMWIFNDFFYI